MRYFCGFEFVALPGWEAYVGEVKHPSNYKDPEKIALYINSRMEELSATANTHPLAGGIRRAVIIKDGANVFDEVGQFVGTKFLEFIFKDSGLQIDSTKRASLLVAGCYIRTALRMSALEYISINGTLPFALHWALEIDPDFRYNRMPGFMDPVSVFAGSSTHGPAAVANRFKLPVNIDNAESLAVLTSQLSARLGF